jgi:flagellin
MANITLTAGMRQNLFSLQNTNTLMEKTQSRLATGRKVNSALDDPVAFFAAAGHTQRANDLATRKDGMSEAIGLVNAANNGIEAIVSLIEAAKALAQSAQSAEGTTEKLTLETQFNAMLTNITNLGLDSGYKGTNLLNGTTETSVVTFDATGDRGLTLTGFDAEACTGLGVVDGVNWEVASSTNVGTSITNLDDAITELRTESKKMANNLSIITTRQGFTDKMMNTLEDGAANLTNADMNEESANMLMLQTRQALGTTSLSMASQAAQSVLRLF